MFMFDIETLGVESNAVVLSAAIIQFDLDKTYTFDELVNQALFVKFDVKEQVAVKRTADKQAVEWWARQSEHAKRKSLFSSKFDMNVKDGVELIKSRVDFLEGLDKKPTFWQRGGLDQLVFDSLQRSFGLEPFIEYWDWMDVRTAINLTAEDASKGYRPVKNLDMSKVIKHDPIHDCALDILMLTEK